MKPVSIEDFCLEHELALANTMFKEHTRRLWKGTFSKFIP